MGSNETILIFEDDKSQASILWDILDAHGYRAVITENYTRAQSLVPEAAIALIDLHLSEQSGIEVLKELKLANPSIEAIIITGYADLQSAIDSLNLGAYAYMEKPVNAERLLFIISKAMEKRQLYLEVKRREQEIKGLTVITSDILNDRIRMLEQAKEKEEKLSRIYRSISLAFKSLDTLQTGKELLPLIAEACKANLVRLSLIGQEDESGDRLEYYTGMEPIKAVEHSGAIQDEIIKTGKPVIISNLEKYPSPNPDLLCAGLKSLAGYPLKVEGTTYAVLFVYSFKENAFAEYEDVLSSLADVCAIPLRTTLHYREAENARQVWETAINEMRPGIVLMDREGSLIKANKAFAKLVNRPLEELFGKNVCELVHGCLEPIRDCPMEKASLSGESASVMTKEPFLRIKKLQLRVIPIKEANGHISHFLHTFLDIKSLYHE